LVGFIKKYQIEFKHIQSKQDVLPALPRRRIFFFRLTRILWGRHPFILFICYWKSTRL